LPGRYTLGTLSFVKKNTSFLAEIPAKDLNTTLHIDYSGNLQSISARMRALMAPKSTNELTLTLSNGGYAVPASELKLAPITTIALEFPSSVRGFILHSSGSKSEVDLAYINGKLKIPSLEPHDKLSLHVKYSTESHLLEHKISAIIYEEQRQILSYILRVKLEQPFSVEREMIPSTDKMLICFKVKSMSLLPITIESINVQSELNLEVRTISNNLLFNNQEQNIVVICQELKAVTDRNISLLINYTHLRQDLDDHLEIKARERLEKHGVSHYFNFFKHNALKTSFNIEKLAAVGRISPEHPLVFPSTFTMDNEDYNKLLGAWNDLNDDIQHIYLKDVAQCTRKLESFEFRSQVTEYSVFFN
jgi:hypothetical protein